MKMLGKVKKFGRSYRSNYVTDEIQKIPLGRNPEKQMVRKEIEQEINELIITQDMNLKEHTYYCKVCDEVFNRLVVISQKDNMICAYCHCPVERRK